MARGSVAAEVWQVIGALTLPVGLIYGVYPDRRQRLERAHGHAIRDRVRDADQHDNLPGLFQLELEQQYPRGVQVEPPARTCRLGTRRPQSVRLRGQGTVLNPRPMHLTGMSDEPHVQGRFEHAKNSHAAHRVLGSGESQREATQRRESLSI